MRRLEEGLGRGLVREIAVESLLLNPEVENGLLKKLVWPLYLDIGTAAGQALLAELGADPEIFTLVDTPAMAALENKLIKVVGINDTVREQLRDALIEGLGKMETTDELMDRDQRQSLISFNDNYFSRCLTSDVTGKCKPQAGR
ncbi:MAG: hypothetical protein QME75_10255 [Deltaproteobacteria bacterium]|nr:hypothetical protein [Deltaproteobacteria bacterium]